MFGGDLKILTWSSCYHRWNHVVFCQRAHSSFLYATLLKAPSVAEETCLAIFLPFIIYESRPKKLRAAYHFFLFSFLYAALRALFLGRREGSHSNKCRTSLGTCDTKLKYRGTDLFYSRRHWLLRCDNLDIWKCYWELSLWWDILWFDSILEEILGTKVMFVKK